MTSSTAPADLAPASVTAIEWLRAETRAAHERLEGGLHVARPDAGRDAFLSYLLALHAWQAGFEERLWHAPWPVAMQAAERAGKCAWMQADLAHCGLRPLAQGPRWQAPLGGLAQRVGLAYVVEGAQLGTRVLAQRLAPALDGWQPRWLQGYGAQTGPRWKSFLAEIEILLPSAEARREAAQAARLAFETLTAWFEHCGAASPLPSAARAS